MTPEEIRWLCDLAEQDWQDFCDCGKSTHAPTCACWAFGCAITLAKRELESRFFVSVIATARRHAALEERVEGMLAEGCAALGVLENIFNGLTSGPDAKVLKEMAAAAAWVLVTAKHCDHKEQNAELRKALEGEQLNHLATVAHEADGVSDCGFCAVLEEGTV